MSYKNNFRINETEIATKKMILPGDVFSQSYPNFNTQKPAEKKTIFLFTQLRFWGDEDYKTKGTILLTKYELMWLI